MEAKNIYLLILVIKNTSFTIDVVNDLASSLGGDILSVGVVVAAAGISLDD